MGRFLTELNVIEVKRGTLFRRPLYKIASPLIYWSSTLDDYIIVDTGRLTDFDSTPRIIPFLYAFLGDRGKAPSVLHDFGYTSPHETSTGSGKILSRAQWDQVLRGATYEGLRLSEPETVADSFVNILSIVVAWCIWAGVRLGGWRRWQN